MQLCVPASSRSFLERPPFCAARLPLAQGTVATHGWRKPQGRRGLGGLPALSLVGVGQLLLSPTPPPPAWGSSVTVESDCRTRECQVPGGARATRSTCSKYHCAISAAHAQVFVSATSSLLPGEKGSPASLEGGRQPIRGAASLAGGGRLLPLLCRFPHLIFHHCLPHVLQTKAG